MRKSEAQGVETGTYAENRNKIGEGQRLSTSFAMISMRKVLAQSTGLVGMSYAQAGALCNITKELFALKDLRTSFSGFDKKTENPTR